MTNSIRVIVNTLSQYLRSVICAIISLYTSRVVLKYLGVSDYGINDLIAGVIALFTFIDYTISQTTQRYLSFYQGKGDIKKCSVIFNNSIITQLVLASLISLILIAITNPVFNSLLNIESNRIGAAHTIYYFMIASLFLNLMSTPYQAALIAHENIVYSSLVQILDSLLKIPIAFSLIWILYDKLEWYGLCNFIVIVINFMLYFLYAKKKYVECHTFSFKLFDKQIFREMFAFLGWTLYGTACVVGRSRGLAIIINRFFSTAMNGALGIGSQISNQLSVLSSALTTALRPQIIKAEGVGDRNKMIHLTEVCCKFSVFFLLMISIPFFVEMDNIMELWLFEVPAYAVFFAKSWIVSQVVDQMTVGLTVANAAVGNVKSYNIMTNTIKVMALPVIYVSFKMGYPVEFSMYIYIAFELICSIVRLLYMKHNIDLSISMYFKNVLLPLLLPSLVTVVIAVVYHNCFRGIMFIGNFALTFIVLSILTYFVGLSKEEKGILLSLISRIKCYGKKN